MYADLWCALLLPWESGPISTNRMHSRGLTNKLLSRKVSRVFIAFEEAAGYFKTKDRPVVVGNPVRKLFSEISREEARRVLGISQDDFVVLSFGGSLGAKKINEEMKIAAHELKDRKGLRIFFVTGRRYYDEIVADADPENERVTYLKYIDNMAGLSQCLQSGCDSVRSAYRFGNRSLRKSIGDDSLTLCDKQSSILQCESGGGPGSFDSRRRK